MGADYSANVYVAAEIDEEDLYETVIASKACVSCKRSGKSKFCSECGGRISGGSRRQLKSYIMEWVKLDNGLDDDYTPSDIEDVFREQYLVNVARNASSVSDKEVLAVGISVSHVTDYGSGTACISFKTLEDEKKNVAKILKALKIESEIGVYSVLYCSV